MKSIPKISVIIISYNQEGLIARAIDSVLAQKDYVYEIIISDDCSKDNTWSVIEKYVEQYPNIIKANHHNENLGVYKNLSSTWSKVSGDIIFTLAGDDIFCDQLFSNVVNLIHDKKIDYKGSDFLVMGDFATIDTHGNKRVYKNSKIEEFSHYNPISLKIRGLIFNRSMGLSMSVIKQRLFVEDSVNEGVSYMQESLIDLQPYLIAKQFYYFPYVGSIYYSQIGLSSVQSRNMRLQTQIEYCENLHKHIDTLSVSDRKWLGYEKKRALFNLKPSVLSYIAYFLELICITNLEFGFDFILKEYKIFIKNFKKLIFP